MKAIAQRDLEQLFQLSLEMLSIVRANGTFKHVNPSWSQTLGWAPEEMVNRPYIDFVHPDDHEATGREAARLAAGEQTIDFENRYRAKDGTYHWMSWRVAPSADGELLYCATRDVTDARRVRDELERQTKALDAAREDAVRANMAKSDFLSRMSHELRTPLNAILGFAQLFERDRMTADERDNVRHILAGGRHLLDLINEVIDISRVESGTLALSNEAIDVDDAVRAAAGIIRPLAAQRGIDVAVNLSPDTGLAVLADRQRLRQVLLNLLSNAVKYNRQGGSITLTVRRSASRRVQISVSDTGPGIPPQMLPYLFQPFERLGAERTATEGTGLGLALSRALCVAMGGQLNVESIVDQGCTFMIDLAETDPADKPATSLTVDGVASTDPADSSGLIVYIEDNLANVKLMERIVAKRPGLQLLHAGDGRSGVALVTERKPALVLLDLQLPEMTGESVLHELWKAPATRSIPVVVLTADASRGLPQRLVAAGARACLTKPLDVQQVLATIDKLVSAGETTDG